MPKLVILQNVVFQPAANNERKIGGVMKYSLLFKLNRYGKKPAPFFFLTGELEIKISGKALDTVTTLVNLPRIS